MCPPIQDIDVLPDSFGMLVGQVKTELTRAIDRELGERGMDLRVIQVQALRRLHVSGPMSAGELARSLCHDGGAMTRLLDRLEERGYLARHPDPDDRRALRIELSAAGRALSERLAECSEQVLDHALRHLDAAERRQLTDYLQRVLVTLRHDN